MKRFEKEAIFHRFSPEDLKSDLKVIGIYWLLLLPFFVLLEKTGLEGFVDNAIFYLLGISLITINVIVLAYVFIPRFLMKKRYGLFFSAFVVFQILLSISSHLISIFIF